MTEIPKPDDEKPVITNQPLLINSEKSPEQNMETITNQPTFNGNAIDLKNQEMGPNEMNEEELKKKKEELQRSVPNSRVVEDHSCLICISCYDPYPYQGCCCCDSDGTHTHSAAITDANDGCCDGCCDDSCCNDNCCDCGDGDCCDCGDCGDCNCDCDGCVIM